MNRLFLMIFPRISMIDCRLSLPFVCVYASALGRRLANVEDSGFRFGFIDTLDDDSFHIPHCIVLCTWYALPASDTGFPISFNFRPTVHHSADLIRVLRGVCRRTIATRYCFA